MKRIALVLSVVLLSLAAKSQTGFPSTDSLHRYNNRFIRNSAVEAFSNLRLNTLLHGIISWIDTARAEGSGESGSVSFGIDTLYALNDSTLAYRRNGNTYTITSSSLYDVRNGLTRYGGVIGFGGTLVEPTLLDLNGNTLTFANGTFQVGTGDYINQLSTYSLTADYDNLFQTWRQDPNYYSAISATLSGASTEAHLQAGLVDGTAFSEVILNRNQLKLYHSTGNVEIPFLRDSATGYSLQYKPISGEIFYTIGGSGGGSTVDLSAVDSAVNDQLLAKVNMDENYFDGDGTPSNKYTPKIDSFAFKSDLIPYTTRIDSIVTNWPLGPGSSSRTAIRSTSNVGDSILVKVNDSVYTQKKLRAGANVTFSVTDSTITITSTPGSAEVNTIPGTFPSDGSVVISEDAILESIQVKPASNLSAFSVGVTGDLTKYSLVGIPITASGEWTALDFGVFIAASTNVRLTGITASTQIKVIFKVIHE